MGRLLDAIASGKHEGRCEMKRRGGVRRVWLFSAGLLCAALVAVAGAAETKKPAATPAPAKPAAAAAAKQPEAEKPAPIKLPQAVLAERTRPAITVAKIDRSTRPKVQEAAKRIDRMLKNHWRKHGVERGDPLSDSRFVRRAYLELGGRIPTFDETVAFLDSRYDGKRAELIDVLLESPDYVSHFYNYWADILRLCERPLPDLYLEPYLDWVKRSIADNTPYDKWVFKMLTADGKVWENPAVGFQLRDKGMPLPYVDNTVRVFLGTQIGCAQCHDHPFDHWTQKQFYELAAFTSGTRMRLVAGPPKGTPPKDAAKAQQQANAALSKRSGELSNEVRKRIGEKKVSGEIGQFLSANLTAVSYDKPRLALPHDYKYDDAKPNAAVEPKVLWGAIPGDVEDRDARTRFAAWMVSKDNRQFARTIANRLWRKLMGVGIVEPVDDFRDDNKPSFPELLEHLTDEIIRLEFDLREFVRIIVSTEAWQSRAVIHDPTGSRPFLFTAPALKRMTAEQLWDSIITLVAHNPWPFQRPSSGAFARMANVDVAATNYAQLEQAFLKFADVYSMGKYQQGLQKNFGYQGQVLVRASELPTPLPLGHFLRQFGQGDRQSIEASGTSPTVPQILAMFNGPITHCMLERGSVIYDEVITHDPKHVVDVIFVSLHSHRPSPDDRSLALKHIRGASTPAAGYGHLIWALLNTREFIFVQ